MIFKGSGPVSSLTLAVPVNITTTSHYSLNFPALGFHVLTFLTLCETFATEILIDEATRFPSPSHWTWRRSEDSLSAGPSPCR